MNIAVRQWSSSVLLRFIKIKCKQTKILTQLKIKISFYKKTVYKFLSNLNGIQHNLSAVISLTALKFNLSELQPQTNVVRLLLKQNFCCHLCFLATFAFWLIASATIQTLTVIIQLKSGKRRKKLWRTLHFSFKKVENSQH